MTQPIKPNEIDEPSFPDEVIECYNNLIQHHWNGKESVFTLLQIHQEIETLLDPDMGIPSHWFWKAEQTYREAGWNVKYDENYRLIFSKATSNG